MAIKCYLFTNMARQLNHTYYSLENNKFLYFYHNLIDFHNEVNKIVIRPFVYEVEVEPKTILSCDYFGLVATEFKAIREVEFSELVNTYPLTTRTKNEINSILNGTAELSKVVSLYKRIFQKSKWDLSKAEQFKLLALLNQNHYELPTINITWCYQIPYVKMLKFFNKSYSTDSNDSSVLNKIKREELYGSKDFETGVELPMKELVCHINLKQYIETRKLSQEQFEEYCEYMFTEERTIYYTSHAIAAGYKILPEHRSLFYPFVLYHGIEDNLDIIDREKKPDELLKILFDCGYKFKGADYSNMPSHDKITEAKIIFQKGFKYIE